MSETATPQPAAAPAAAAPAKPSIGEIFFAFLTIGATSFGGGAVAYLRSTLVGAKKWVDDNSFLELYSISQSLPGLNTTNMAILVGDRLQGWVGAVAGVVGIILPGAILMTIAAMLYGVHGDRPYVTAALHGVAAAATGLILATFFQLARKSLKSWIDVVFIIVAVIAVNWFHVSVLYALLGIAFVATLVFHPRKADKVLSTEPIRE